ncbi:MULTISPECIES: 3-carboxy-cis,cis-muconate cycloisomerase [unclassified Lysobacter]|uniref:3-carboxy-cis,cis-muconate cycloisomerase n=1 Tax=unclassified Lysobacter TaxID=2635362 RepID=UPI001BEB4482|nr:MULTISPECIES: 3-carboxy-cis,cis-muconate cycloisomerase [unclassified Lysobacter]MBT2748857.1 3-carboxy-cis,cis-muconate cycloisomerase [Lysobacter sp. ISL-42]MBT2751096.1 3-carboxy-cis,cis-muconate cycloisomerase [Lysobacter sp. ISL-50]MBT2779642.1 3-carboxy-cis,cis-muconate cycloisomerase [Lysobacter sp. ISL-54]MBT2783412.1 3-carboxy-cis,cis-muconate cycloisomerase [Lysobacter sp. ISL-52]
MTARPIPLFDPLFGEAAMGALFDDRARVQAMLDFEAALARAQAHAGLFAPAIAERIGSVCDVARFDLDALAVAAAADGNPAIGLVKALTAQVALIDARAAAEVHRGATSQDAIDTGTVLQARAGLDLIEARIEDLIAVLAALAREHRRSVMPGRTWLQQAVPISFGLKAACWLDAVVYARRALRELRPRVLALQFGGAAGSLSALGADGVRVGERLALELELNVPAAPWHGQRGRIVELGAWLAMLIGGLGKIARDIALLMQNEIAEVSEPAAPGRGGSSAMPNKRNPVACAVAIAAATRAPGLVSTLFAAMPQEHERGLGGWPAEWETLPELFRLAGGSLTQLQSALAGLRVDTAAMRAHCLDGLGLIQAEAVAVALAARFGREGAQARVRAACDAASRQSRHLREVLADDREIVDGLGRVALDALFEPECALGANDALIDRVLAQLD